MQGTKRFVLLFEYFHPEVFHLEFDDLLFQVLVQYEARYKNAVGGESHEH